MLTYKEWLNDQWNRPNRTDYYLMQLTAIIRSALENKTISIEQVKLDWKAVNPVKVKQQEKEINTLFEQRTMAALGVTW